MWRAELQQLNGPVEYLVAAGEEGVHGEVGEPVEVLQAGVDPNLGGEVRMRELVHCPPTNKTTNYWCNQGPNIYKDTKP
jgi:hypothetical protein